MSALCKADRESFDMKAIQGATRFGEYDLYLNLNRGGPGIGDPLERDPAAVVRDVNERQVLERFAASLYGVVITGGPDGRWVLDAEATTKKREAMRADRLKRSVPASEFHARQRQRILDKAFGVPVREMYASSMHLSPEWAAKFRNFWQLDADWSF